MRFILSFLAVISISYLHATNVFGWRADGTGHFKAIAHPPQEWGPEQGIVWKQPLGPFSNATPIMLRGKLYVCAEVDELICLDAETGQILWRKSTPEAELLTEAEKAHREQIRKELAPVKEALDKSNKEYRKIRRALRKDRDNTQLKEKEQVLKKEMDQLKKQLAPLTAIETPKTHKVNGYSSPTPVTDGKNIYAMFGTGVVAAFTPEGQRLWARVVEKPAHGWGHSSSPVLAGDKLVVAYQNIFALDPQNGNEVWRVSSKAHWGTPAVATVAGVPVVITCEGQLINAETGKVHDDKLVSLDYNSPMVADGIVYTYDTQNARAHRLPPSLAAEPELLWDTTIAKDRYYASPVLVDGILYGITRNSMLTTIDAETGEKLYEKKLDIGKGTIYPSPAVAGGLVYISSDNGTTIVLKPGREYEEIQRNELEGFRSCPTFIGDRLYIRGLDSMYCIGK